MPNTKIGKFSVEPIASRYDSRVGLGYGLSQDRFHKPRSASSQFPYIVDEPTRRPTAAVAGSGAAFPSGVGRRPRTGSGRGYASAPPMSKIEAQMDYEEESEEENYSLKDFAIDDDNLG